MSSLRKAISTNLKALGPRRASSQGVRKAHLFKPYSPINYNLMLSLGRAKSTFDEHDGMSVVKNDLRPLFQKYGLQDKFGAGLVHRHFDLRPDERLVEYNGTSTPWQCRDCFLGRKIVPIAWHLDGDKYVPYEFRFATSPEDIETASELERQTAFLGEMQDVLHRRELDWVLGLRAMPITRKESLLEVTQGRANISIPQSELPDDEQKKPKTETMWFFDQELERIYACNCSDVMESHRHY
ncbi:hypothetical protein PMZ80_001262 [Knufia obscura]|uniref:Uncharacterized protein n=1 Tax=Knufia obscura TaxID=1635080 RepID=A0ABR0S2N0_9EURO|nr:hypothetical protein PMZ80_001262 [Knufia obscura]